MATILVMNGPCEGRWFPVPIDRPLVVGRDRSLLATLPDVKTSRHHLEVRFMPYENGYVVADKASRNGVFVNGHRISHYKTLAEEDRIRLGYTVLIFTEHDFEDQGESRQFLRKALSRHQDDLQRIKQEQATRSAKPEQPASRFNIGRLLGWGRPE
ncbi:FHA domain-containing protein [Phycisphaerales bacterium AB-hyl4]|uniref:FHA domain-containing protein n=1 Tax=Natronomicrosphaera hydrolytica TaxID=3242702 RepID=A0ABV4U152_9BACT